MTEPQEHPGAAANFPTVGRWRVTALPRGWMYIANFGIRQMIADSRGVPANVSLGDDLLAEPDALQAYIARQSSLIGTHLRESKMAGPQLMSFPGADEAFLFFVRHAPQSAGNLLHAQTYVRSGNWVGIVTLTTLESELKVVRPDYDAFVKGLRIVPALERDLPA